MSCPPGVRTGNEREGRVLRMLAPGPLTNKQLATRLGCSANSISVATLRMSKDGKIRRVLNESDAYGKWAWALPVQSRSSHAPGPQSM